MKKEQKNISPHNKENEEVVEKNSSTIHDMLNAHNKVIRFAKYVLSLFGLVIIIVIFINIFII